jgi:hypothetical protein
MIHALWTLFLAAILNGCGGGASSPGSSGESDGTSANDSGVVIDPPAGSPCQRGAFYQIVTKECITLKHPAWGFQGFATPQTEVTLTECGQSALDTLLQSLPEEGAVVHLPACTLQISETIGLYNNVILEGAGKGKTIITGEGVFSADLLSLRGRNIIVRDLTLDGAGNALGGIVCTNNRGNLLIEKCEIKNLTGSGIYLETAAPQADTQITIRQNSISHTLHGMAIKTRDSAKMLIYSNQLFANREYGLDMSTTSDIEVSGNYMHDNFYAGAKSPIADRIWYYHNTITHNGNEDRENSAGIVYMLSRPEAKIYIEYNDLQNNRGLAYASWNADFSYLLLRENLVAGSHDSNGYTIRATGIDDIDVYGDHGRIWVGEGNEGRIHYH